MFLLAYRLTVKKLTTTTEICLYYNSAAMDCVIESAGLNTERVEYEI